MSVITPSPCFFLCKRPHVMLPAWPFSIFKCLFTFDCCCKNFEVLPNIVFPLPQVTSDGICHMGGAHHLCFPLRNWDCSAWPLCSHTHGFCTCAQQLKWFIIIIIFFWDLKKAGMDVMLLLKGQTSSFPPWSFSVTWPHSFWYYLNTTKEGAISRAPQETWEEPWDLLPYNLNW